MAYDEHRQVVMMAGGQMGYPPDRPEETWQWDGVDWQQLHTITIPPELAGRPKLVYLPALQEIGLINHHFIKNPGELPTEHLEGWRLTFEYINFLPFIKGDR